MLISGLIVAVATGLGLYWSMFSQAVMLDGPGIKLPWIGPAVWTFLGGALGVLVIAVYLQRGLLLVVPIIVFFGIGYADLGPRIMIHRWSAECHRGDAHACVGAAGLAGLFEQPQRRCDLFEQGCRNPAKRIIFNRQVHACSELLAAPCNTKRRRTLACPTLKAAATTERPLDARDAAACRAAPAEQ
jgi:hypothetical protein